MSVADSSPRVMEIVGPSGLYHFLASMRFYVFRFVGLISLTSPPSILNPMFVPRNTLGLKVSEIPDSETEPQVEAIPVFKDDNITVFSIPIVPTSAREDTSPAESDALPNAPENILKRKRELSPELPSKRPSLPSTTDGSPTLSPNPPLLDRSLDDAQFDPATLEGDEAEAWRRLIVEYMFTWTEPPPKSKPQQLHKPSNKKGKRGQNSVDIEIPEAQPSQLEANPTSLPQVPHWVEDAVKSQGKPLRPGIKGANPAGSLKSLPTFTPPVREGSAAYIVVGPQVRGKFDAKRAEELGLYGPLRGKVARGETVTFTVDDGVGGVVQRTVRPEDCVGEHEITKVRLPISAPRSMC